jgi:thiol-disulfide isomerase/thioredoxin
MKLIFFIPIIICTGFITTVNAQYSSGWWDTTLNGKPIKPFSMLTPESKKISSEKLKGKVVVLDFWASWCVPCIKLTAELDSALNKYYDKGLTMIGVNYRESVKKNNPVAYWKKHGYKFSMTVNNDEYGKKVGAGNPTVIVIDQQGIVRGKWEAWTELRATEVEMLVWFLLEKPAITEQAVLDANLHKQYIKALFLYDRLTDTAEKRILAQEKFKALLHVSELDAVDFAKEWRTKTADSENTLATIGDYISQTEGLAPKVNAFGAEAFQTLITKYPDNGGFIAYDLMGRCYFRDGEIEKAIAASEKSISIAKSEDRPDALTIDYLESVLAKYKSQKNN